MEEVMNIQYRFPPIDGLSEKQKILLDNFWGISKRTVRPEIKTALEKLSRALSNEFVLVKLLCLPLDKSYKIVETDASTIGWAGILYEKKNK